jgi:hypothetical protein
MANELMDKRMTEDELDNVVGGAKVMIITHTRLGLIDGYFGDYQGSQEALDKLLKEGNVAGIRKLHKWGKVRMIKKPYLERVKENFRKRGYKVIEVTEPPIPN